MKINSVNATFQPAKIGTAHGLQITYLKDNSTRNIFVYHEDGKVRFGASLPICPAPPSGNWVLLFHLKDWYCFEFVCLFFILQNTSKTNGRICAKSGGDVGHDPEGSDSFLGDNR